jgi:hypothetical protein
MAIKPFLKNELCNAWLSLGNFQHHNMGNYRAPKFLVDPLEGLGIWQCGRSWNSEHDPNFQH